ncbi:TonB-dependent receptor [Sphingobium sufflavum]|uniref:TonB-dependent receptor n=1 Tax=Sphingobium sufflavum TaxID=1129547 RepID=UPI001F29E39D|nr:TonB-dependent receptor [Sphingobium sufflavum]MCE7798284.1 TonB-dependent receptor [Sphingobium sufflavum]
MAQARTAAAQEQAKTPQSDEQSAASDGQDQIIIVEARRRNEVLQDVPLTINAVTSETIEKLNLRNFQEITSVVPGLSLSPNANGIGSSSSMRGVNQDVNVSGENGTIQFYFNDAPVGSNFVLQAMYDLGQVEVLRGPQGTLRGRATPSGSITVAPRRPDLNQAGGTIIGTVASDGAANLQFGINVPIIADKLAVRVAGLGDHGRGSRIRSVNSTVQPRAETESIRVSVRAEPMDWLRGGFLYQSLQATSRQFDQVQSYSNLVPGFTPGIDQNISPLPAGTILGSAALTSPRLNSGFFTPQDRAAVTTDPRTLRQTFRFYGWNLGVDFAGQTLVYVGSRLENDFRNGTNQDQGVTFPALRLFQDGNTISKGNTHEIRLQNVERVANLFDYVVGYFRQTGSAEINLTQSGAIRGYFPVTNAQDPRIPAGVTALSAVTGAIFNGTPIYSPPSASTEESYFGNVVAYLGEGFELSGGLRHIKFDNETDGLFISCTRQTYGNGTCRRSPGTENDYKVSKTIYSATARYKVNDDLMVYAMTGTSFRPPVRAVGNFSSRQTALELSHVNLDAETSTSYEIGIKSQWFDKRLTFNLTGYHQDFKNYPFRAATGIYYINVNSSGQDERGQFNFVSAVPVSINGLESEITFAPSRTFRITAITNYSHSKIKASQLACTDVNRDGIPDTAVPTLGQLQTAYQGEHLAECPSAGQPATFLPRLSGSVQAELTLPLDNRFDGYVRGLLNWRGEGSTDPNNPYDDVGAYGIFNLYAGIRSPGGNWELTAFAKNLFNLTKVVSAESSPYTTAVTYVNLGAGGAFGSASYQSNYSGVTVTPPREFGLTARVSLGSR